MIVMQYATDGDLFSFLDRNTNKLTWKMKIDYLRIIASNLKNIHDKGLIHCDLHGGNIVLNNNNKFKEGKDYKVQLSKPFICDLGLSRLASSSESTFSTVRGVLHYIAPEVLHTRKFTQKSDTYSFGILMHQIASGEQPFRNWSSDDCLAIRICEGLRPEMPDSAPEPYKKLAQECCDADPNKRPTAEEIIKCLDNARYDRSILRAVYHNKNIKPLSRIEKESKYTSKLLPTGNLPSPRNSWDKEECVNSAAGKR